ncbi:sensor histidine kinase [Phytopseudomonas dryadis]|uniref:histidine kinase n=1 Tax=Phytopseudomonas dryadis TaxID=2487520 RepID=A0ABY1ZFP1_9GAMM|nr:MULTISPECIES: sensor histidine kinase [Pseudomonas]TBV09385.1 hypothetical protein DNK34_02285 [Pseudomonas dryadis]TBV18773.1 hypothetical protein DNK41_07025 [Pseudomonas sp. FRB 230]
MNETGGKESSESAVIDTFRLEVHPSVVFKLGADLITDDMQALIELVKNSYDADASRVSVNIDTQTLTDAETGEIITEEHSSLSKERKLRALRGIITISDDGIGMDLDTIRRGWLTVSLSHKQLMKSQGKTTAKERTPLGDKGLGRLGAQRLGDVITLITRKRTRIGSEEPVNDDATLRVSIKWGDFSFAESLSSVPIKVERLPTNKKPGTTLQIRGLRDPQSWTKGETSALQKEIAAMISPYEGVSGFRISFTIDGVNINLRETAQAILSAAPVVYRFKYDGHKLTVDGAFSIDFLRPTSRDEIAIYESLIARDNGYAFSEWMLQGRQKKSSLGVKQGDDKYFLLSHSNFQIDEISNIELDDGLPVNPGSFSGEVSSIPLTRDTTNIFNRNAEYKDFVKALVGIKVYRDGFGVRVDDDWLGLGTKWTSGSSYYSLRPGNVAGYISISAKYNSALEETTNREAFRDTPAYRNFYKLLMTWADYTGRLQEHIRRSYNDYKQHCYALQANVEVRATPESLLKNASAQIEQVSNLARKSGEARQQLRRIQEATVSLEDQKSSSDRTLFQDPELRSAVDRTVKQVTAAASEAEELISGLDALLEEQSRLKAGLSLLSEQIEVAQNQIGEAWESVALGLGAESLTHEVLQISDGLRGRSSQITQYLKSIDCKDQRIWGFVEHIRSSSSSLAKQVSRISPSLRYVRENRDDVLMSQALEDIITYHSERWGKNGLNFDLSIISDFTIRINPGRLTQIFDNLILNSEYWLLHALRIRRQPEGTISIKIDQPFVIFSDNGSGIDASVEELIFDPFITLKPSQQGRGLGLFVVRQLLDSEQSSIFLTPERNSDGRRYEFLLNFSGCTINSNSVPGSARGD